MTTRPNITVPKVNVKGDLVACFATNTRLEMWFQSPNGDSSDVQICYLTCVSEAQAEAIAKRHREAWGL